MLSPAPGSVPFEVEASQTVHVTIAAEGRPVTGRVVLAPDTKEDVRIGGGGGALCLAGHPVFFAYAYRSKEDKEKTGPDATESYAVSGKGIPGQSYEVSVEADGHFRIEEVLPGRYNLVLRLFAPPSEPCAKGARPDPTATAAPPDDPPAVRSASQMHLAGALTDGSGSV